MITDVSEWDDQIVNSDGGVPCWQEEWASGFVCTQRDGHTGPHIARIGDLAPPENVCAAWPNEAQS